jgi:hypothetical protein
MARAVAQLILLSVLAIGGSATACTVDVDCNDHDVCTDDRCDGEYGCVHTPHCSDSTCHPAACVPILSPFGVTSAFCFPLPALRCDDGSVCTVDRCVDPAGCLHEPIPVDDLDVCTLDTCDASAGVSHEPLLGCCNVDAECGGDKCSLDRRCVDHSCIGGTPVTCDDADPCTTDWCNPIDGCLSRARAGYDELACICDRPMPGPCAGSATPRAIEKRLTKTCDLIVAARSAEVVRARKLLGRVIGLLRRAQKTATHASGKLPPGCGAAIAAQLGDGQDRAASAQQLL